MPRQRPIGSTPRRMPGAAKQPSAEVRARVRLRDATEDDIQALVDIINAAYRPVDWWLFGRLRTSEEEYRRELGKPGAQSIIAERDSEPVAHVALWLERSGTWAGAWIGMVATAPQAQGQGIATLLAEEVERRAASAGFRVVKLSCVRENGLVEYYESLGYEVEREERGLMWDALHEWTHTYMRKALP